MSNNDGVREELLSSDKQIPSQMAFNDDGDETEEVSRSENSHYYSKSYSPRRSILKSSTISKKAGKRISFHENYAQVHEVESWKKENKPDKGCCERCWEECNLI